MIKGHLHRLPKSKKWVVRYRRTPQIITELPVHPSDVATLKKSSHLKQVMFEVETVAIGESEWDVMDCDVAKIACTAKLYSKIESAIIKYTVDGTITAGELTRKIIKLVNAENK